MIFVYIQSINFYKKIKNSYVYFLFLLLMQFIYIFLDQQIATTYNNKKVP